MKKATKEETKEFVWATGKKITQSKEKASKLAKKAVLEAAAAITDVFSLKKFLQKTDLWGTCLHYFNYKRSQLPRRN